MPTPFTPTRLAEAITSSTSWAGVMRHLEVRASGGRRRTLQAQARAHGLDTGHFTRTGPRRYTDQALAEAVASSTTVREVVVQLGGRPSSGTLSHLRRRIAAAGIETGHFPALHRTRVELPFTRDELVTAATGADSVRAVARALDMPDDGRSRAALRRTLQAYGVDISHLTRQPPAVIPEDALRNAVTGASSFADVMRRLGLPVNDAHHRRVQRRARQLGISTRHFTRAPRRSVPPARAPRPAGEVLRVHPEGSPRVRHDRLRRALTEIGRPYACAGCGNHGEWRGARMTLQIDHVDGDWLDNRAENLRYLCPNCHAITETWCGRTRPGSVRPPRRSGPKPDDRHPVSSYDEADERP